MAKANQKLFSIVLVGRHNPQILNHDFLVRNQVLPAREPFVKKNPKEGEKPFTDFLSMPPLTQISYDKYSLLVQEDRFQAMDTTGEDPCDTPIIEITKNYFGKLLRYTPFTTGGLNLNSEITFDSATEERSIGEALGTNHHRCKEAFDSEDVVAGITVALPFLAGRMLVVIAKPKAPEKPSAVSFNYEFPYQNNLDDFLSHIDEVREFVAYRNALYGRIGVSI